MKLVKGLLLGSAAALAVVGGAEAADLPSKKAVAVNYVKICDAYGSGFFFIPGTETCIRLGGYVRAEYQYTPAQATYGINGTIANNGKAYSVTSVTTAATPTGTPPTNVTSITAANSGGVITQFASAQDTTGFEMRGRIDVDARTPTDLGTVRTFVRLRLTNTSGIRNTAIVNGGNYVLLQRSAAVLTGTAATANPGINQILPGTGPTIESALIQWAGFTFGVAPENYALMPTFMYHSNPWTGFPNGMNQLSYTATFGGGFSATLAIEDMGAQNNATQVFDRPGSVAAIVGNVRLDQGWGFAAIHGAVQNNAAPVRVDGSAQVTATNNIGNGFTVFSASNAVGQATTTGWAVGSTLSFKLPMIAAGDQVWFTSNYAHGFIGMIGSAGGLNNVMSTASDHRLIGGVLRVDNNIVATGLGNGIDSTNAWNLAGAYVHYWDPKWRSNFTAGYIQMNPPTVAKGTIWWGKGELWELAGSLIYSPIRDFDIGLEFQYASMKNQIQNALDLKNQDWVKVGLPGLSANNWSTKLRAERTF